jgi:xylan 1,4-beta-xylosidase
VAQAAVWVAGSSSCTAGALPRTLAVADGRTLDRVATGGFLGPRIGVYATCNAGPTTTTAHVQRFEHTPVTPA